MRLKKMLSTETQESSIMPILWRASWRGVTCRWLQLVHTFHRHDNAVFAANFSLSLGGAIGAGLFVGSGSALSTGGPASLVCDPAVGQPIPLLTEVFRSLDISSSVLCFSVLLMLSENWPLCTQSTVHSIHILFDLWIHLCKCIRWISPLNCYWSQLQGLRCRLGLCYRMVDSFAFRTHCC